MRYHSPNDACVLADNVPPQHLSRYLCSMATGSTENGYGEGHIDLNMCRQCESPCGFGKKALAYEKEGIPIVFPQPPRRRRKRMASLRV